MTNFGKVCEFNEAFGGAKSWHVQYKLLTEEFAEVAAEIPSAMYAADMEMLVPEEEYCERMGRLVKELADLLYVTYGFFQVLGVDADKVFEIVHESNMSKLGPDGKPVKKRD